MRVNPAWWHFIGAILFFCILIVAGFILQLNSTNLRHLGLPLLGLGAIGLLSTALRRHFISWSLTSERVIENKGILARHRREMELADVRSVDVERRFMQRAMGLGDIVDRVGRQRRLRDQALRRARSRRRGGDAAPCAAEAPGLVSSTRSGIDGARNTR